jgi:hypothetical protein
MHNDVKIVVFGIEPTTCGSESECATHHTIVPNFLISDTVTQNWKRNHRLLITKFFRTELDNLIVMSDHLPGYGYQAYCKEKANEFNKYSNLT